MAYPETDPASTDRPNPALRSWRRRMATSARVSSHSQIITDVVPAGGDAVIRCGPSSRTYNSNDVARDPDPSRTLGAKSGWDGWRCGTMWMQRAAGHTDMRYWPC